MTLRELKEKVDRAFDRLKEKEDDLEVVIPNNKPSMGPISTTKIKSASQGIDWENGLFVIIPEIPMIEK